MDEVTMLAPIAQFGVAGLMGWMWLTERRATGGRERQLTEAHERLLEQRVQLETMMGVVSENTRAIAALEASQRALGELIRALGHAEAAGRSSRADEPGVYK